MPVKLNSTGITFSNGTSQATAGMVVDTNTASSATAYAIGTYLMHARATGAIQSYALNVSVGTVYRRNLAADQTMAIDDSGSSTALTGTWRSRGGFAIYDSSALRGDVGFNSTAGNNRALAPVGTLIQRTA